MTIGLRILLSLLSIVGAVLVPLARRRLRRRRLGWGAPEATRYTLRVEAPGAEPVRIGTSLEGPAGEGVEMPSSRPALESVEAVLDDGNRRRVLLPAGIRLDVRRFDGAHRVPLE